MKPLLRLLLLLLAWIALSPNKVQAQAEGTAFSCDGTFYQIRQVNNTSSLFRVNRSAATYTTSGINLRTVNGTPTNDLGVLLNGLSYNPQDGYLYALSTTGTSNTVPTAGTIRLYKIGQGGIQDLGATNLPAIQVASGTIDKNGNYYVSSQNSVGTADYNIYRLPLSAAAPADRRVATALRLYNAGNTATTNVTFYDLALNPSNDLLYGVYQNGTLWSIDATSVTGRALVNPIKATATSNDPVGTSFFDVAGNMFVYTNGTVGTANSGGFYQVNLTNGTYTLISNIDPASVSDGASCINPDQRIDIVKEVNTITRNSATQFDIAFTLRVKNTSTATDNNVQINDFLWSGISGGNNGSANGSARANTTFSSISGNLPTSVVVSALTVTADPTNSNPVFLLARNSSYTGVGGTPGTTTGSLLTGNQPLTPGQAAIISFTVRVTYAQAGNVPGGVKNTAYASSSNSANPTGYSQNASTGFLSSPDQLLASDQSTDSPSLPLTANSDTPIPTPVYFSPSISGTVFEDINYGGGLGRTQGASSGQGLENVRVELYTSAGAFLTFTTTDGAGNYVFSTTNGTTALVANTQYQVRVVNSTVSSNRPNPSASTGLVGVQTYIYGAASQNQIGGTNPVRVDLAANTGTAAGTSGQSLTQLRATNVSGGEVQSITTASTPASSNTTSPARLGVDFGFNFSTVVNTNDTGAGSLRQFILNSNALTNENLTQKSSVAGVTLTPGVENAIFMINDGTTVTNGLRAGIAAGANAASYSAATGFTITPATPLPTISDDDTAINGALQAAVTGDKVAAVAGTTTGPEVTINFNNLKGLFVTGGNTTIANLNLNNAKGSVGTGTAVDSDGAGVTLSGASATGSTVTGITTSGNARAGVRVDGGVDRVTILANVLNNNYSTVTSVDADGLELFGALNSTITGNIISGNKGYGIFMAVAANIGNTISNNTIQNNGSGPTTADAGISIGSLSTDNVFSGNTIASNTGNGIMALSGSSNNRFTQNSISGNTNLGIDLSATTTAIGDGITKNANGKTAASGANGLSNFPVITQAVVTSTGGDLQITGYAPAGSTLEFFFSDKSTAGFGQGQTYLFSALEGGTLVAVANGTSASILDGDTKIGSYSGLVNDLDQGAETSAQRFLLNIPLNTFTADQVSKLTNSTTRLTATATINGSTTSEFSGNILIKQNAPLPVTLASFSAKAVAQAAQLTWRTAQEHDNDYFVVERSFDGSSFTTVGQVKGQGTTSVATDYRFTDAQAGQKAKGQVAYYRLRQVDTDGTTAYSSVQAVKFFTTAAISVAPNPASGEAALELGTMPVGQYQVTILDVAGRLVYQASAQGGQAKALPVGQWPAGVYLICVQGQNTMQTTRLIKE